MRGLPEIIAATIAGARITKSCPLPPASMRQTEVSGSSLSREAMTQPADPPPTMT